MTDIQELRRWLGQHRALGTRIMQEGIDIADTDAVAPWQDRMQMWCQNLVSMVEGHDQGEADRFEPLTRLTHSNILPNPLSDEHQMFWRCHFERLIRLDDLLERLNRRYGIAGDTPSPIKRAPHHKTRIPEEFDRIVDREPLTGEHGELTRIAREIADTLGCSESMAVKEARPLYQGTKPSRR